jgi:hypothetical protein
MASPADVQAQANEDVERIASALCETIRPFGMWAHLPEGGREVWRAWVRDLLERDVIRVGRRPDKGEPPMEGQTTIEDVLG